MTEPRYRGWSISPAHWPVPWTATGPDYDASYEGEEDGWVDNGQRVEAPTREQLLIEIDTFIEDMQP